MDSKREGLKSVSFHWSWGGGGADGGSVGELKDWVF